MTLTATDTTGVFSSATATVTIVKPVLQVAGLSSSFNVLAEDAPFYAQGGIEYTGYGYDYFWGVQNVSRAASGPLTVTFTSSNPTAGELVNTDNPLGADTLTAEIPQGSYATPFGVAAGGVAFDPFSPGTTIVTATAPGCKDPFTPASRTVTVTPAALSVQDVYSGTYQVGSRLQELYRVSLSGGNHGGVTIRVVSGNTTRALVSPDASTAGTSFIDLPVAPGGTYADFYVQGRASAAGPVTITATSPISADGTATVTIVQPVLQIWDLSSPNYGNSDLFYVRCGIPDSGFTYLWPQAVSAELVAPLEVTLAVSDGAIGQLTTLAGSGGSAVVQIPQGSYLSPSTVASGGVSFTGLGFGTVTVAASASGFRPSFGPSSASVHVLAFNIPAGQENLSLQSGTLAVASSAYSGFPASNTIDGNA